MRVGVVAGVFVFVGVNVLVGKAVSTGCGGVSVEPGAPGLSDPAEAYPKPLVTSARVSNSAASHLLLKSARNDAMDILPGME